MFDENRLRVFAAVAREGSVTAAAAALHYAQPSVSHHLSRLEADVGIPLLRRQGRGIHLTEAGRLFAERAEEILGRIDAARGELAAHAGLQRGSVRLAAFPSILATLVPGVAAQFTATHPGVEFALTEAEPPQALAALRRGEVDVALAFHHDRTAPDELDRYTVTPLFTEPLYLVGPADQPPVGEDGDLARFADRRWIAGCPNCRAHLLSACRRQGFEPIIGFETDDYVAVQALVAAGAGVATLPGLALKAHRHHGVAIDRLVDDARFVVALTYGSAPLPTPVAALLAELESATATPPQWPGA